MPFEEEVFASIPSKNLGGRGAIVQPAPSPSRFQRPWGNDVNDASRCVDKPRCVCSRHLGPNFSFAWSLACLSIYMQNATQSGEIISVIVFYFFAYQNLCYFTTKENR